MWGGLACSLLDLRLSASHFQPQHLCSVLGGSAEAFTAENECISTFGVIFCVFSGRRVVLDATLSTLLACCTKCVCLWLLSCPGVDRRCGRCHLSPCLLLRHLETLWSPPREVQLAAAGPRCALLPPEARAGGVHLPPVSGMALLSCTSGLGQNASVQKVPFPPENPLSPKKFPFPPENPFSPRSHFFSP